MSCHKCGVQFKIFRKEYGCTKCGFAFCGKCCSQKVVLPHSDSDKKYPVCDKCYEDITTKGREGGSAKYSPPVALQRRMEALSLRKNSLKGKSGGPGADELIAQRLQKLKTEEVPDQHELEERLAKLKGLDPQHFTAPPITVYRPPDTRTTPQKVDGLIEQIQSEVDLESRRPKPEDEIEMRLSHLRGTAETGVVKDDVAVKEVHKGLEASSSSIPTKKEENLEDVYQYLLEETSKSEKDANQALDDVAGDKLLQEELARIQEERKEKAKNAEEVKKEEEEEDESEANAIVEKILAETTLPDAPDSPPENGPESITEDESDELPWCVICTEDAKLRCLDCDRDLYCLRCFRECHDALELREHQTVVYKPKVPNM